MIDLEKKKKVNLKKTGKTKRIFLTGCLGCFGLFILFSVLIGSCVGGSKGGPPTKVDTRKKGQEINLKKEKKSEGIDLKKRESRPSKGVDLKKKTETIPITDRKEKEKETSTSDKQDRLKKKTKKSSRSKR